MLLTLLNLLSLALCVSELPHSRLLADLYLCLKMLNCVLFLADIGKKCYICGVV